MKIKVIIIIIAVVVLALVIGIGYYVNNVMIIPDKDGMTYKENSITQQNDENATASDNYIISVSDEKGDD